MNFETTWKPVDPKRKPLNYGLKNGQAAEFKLVRLRELPVEHPLLDTPDAVARFFQAHVPNSTWYDPEREMFIVFYLNTRRRVNGFSMVSMGTLDTLLVHPRDVYRGALVNAAAAIVIAHNHPSGDPTPSEADISVTRDLIRAGQLLKVELLDHIIMGRATQERPKSYSSLRELGYFYS